MIVLQFSYFPFVRAFIPDTGESGPVVHQELVAIALAVAPFVFIVIALLSRNPDMGKRVLWAMGMLLAVGLSVGLLAPALGAAAGFGVGIALTLNVPDVPDQMKRRMYGVGFGVAYTLLMLFLITPAGVLAGAVVPGLMVGFADEYGAWRFSRSSSS